MTAELSSEEVVTKLLTSNEIIINNKRNLFITNPIYNTLGDFLPEIISDEPQEEIADTKFTFIRTIP